MFSLSPLSLAVGHCIFKWLEWHPEESNCDVVENFLAFNFLVKGRIPKKLSYLVHLVVEV